MREAIIFIAAFFSLLPAFGQVRGIVFGLDKNQKTPLHYAVVKLKNAKTVSATDENGRFELILPKELPDTLEITYDGYYPEQVVVTRDDRFSGLEIVLVAETELEEFVVEYRRSTKSVNRLNPLFVEELGAGELKKAACCNLSESFETNATVDVNLSDAVSGAKKIQLLGLDGVYTQFQAENVPFLTGLENSFGVNSVPGTWVESIQITKGTGTVVNGFESMSGLINVQFQQPRTMPRLFVNGYGNVLGRGELNVQGGQILGERWSTATFVHGSMLQTEIDRNKDGFRDVPLSRTLSGLNRWEYNGKKFEARFGVNAYMDERKGGQLDSAANRYVADNANKHVDFFAKTGFLFPRKKGYSLGIVYQAKLHEQSGQFGNRRFSASEKRGYINAIFDGLIGTTIHKYRLGASLVAQDLSQRLDTLLIPRQLLIPGVFAEYTYTGIRFTAVIGARYDIPSTMKAQFSPRLHLKYALDERTDLRLTTGKSWRIPNVISDNSWLLANNKIWVLPANVQQEIIWNSGISIARRMRLWHREASVSADFYYAWFENQLVADRDVSTDSIFFRFEHGTSSKALQLEFSFMPIRTLTVRMAYKHLNVDAMYGGTRQQQVMIPVHRGLLNFAYATRNKKWEADATFSVFGKMRMQEALGADGNILHDHYSKPVPQLIAQITRHFRKVDVYLGGENLLNFTQKNPIIAASDPANPAFDATRIYGPILGTVVYAGFRYELNRKTEKQ